MIGHAREECVNADIGKDHTDKAHDCENRCASALNAPPDAEMEIKHIDEPCDQRPCLLRIPGPVASPGALRPDRTCDDREGKKEEPERRGAIAHHVQPFAVRNVLIPEVAAVHLLTEKEHQRHGKGDPESSVGYNSRRHVEEKPAAAEGGHEFLHFLALHRGIPDDQKDDRHGERSKCLELIFKNEDQAHQRDAPGKACRKLIIVRERKTACPDRPDNERHCVYAETGRQQIGRCRSGLLIFHRKEHEEQDHRDKVTDHRYCEQNILSRKKHFISHIAHIPIACEGDWIFLSPGSSRSLHFFIRYFHGPIP